MQMPLVGLSGTSTAAPLSRPQSASCCANPEQPTDRLVSTPSSDPTAVAPPPAVDPKLAAAAELEQVWADRLGDLASKTTVGIMTTDGWVKDKFVYLNELADAVIAAGGTPKLIFMGRGEVAPQMQGIQALLVPGGGNINSTFYAPEKGPNGADEGTDVPYDKFQLDGVKLAINQKLPMLGLCRGEQLMNVAGGGDMVPSITSDFKPADGSAPLDHWNEQAFKNRPERRFGTQEIRIQEGSRVSQVLGNQVSAMVNSIHRMCVGAIAPIMAVTAWAMDGVPEAIEVKGAPWQVGVQFHPEWLRLDNAQHQGFFDQLVKDGQKFQSGELLQRPPVPATLMQLA